MAETELLDAELLDGSDDFLDDDDVMNDDAMEDPEISEVEKEELEEVKTEVKDTVGDLQEQSTKLKEEIKGNSVMKDIAMWALKTGLAAGVFTVIGYFVTKELHKSDSGGSGHGGHSHSGGSSGEDGSTRNKADKIQALVKFLKKEFDMFTAVTNWLQKNSDVTINIDGFDITLVSAVRKQLLAVKEASTFAVGVAKDLKDSMKDTGHWSVPTAGQVARVIYSGSKTVHALLDLTRQAEKNEAFKGLLDKVNEDKVLELQGELGVLEHMPYN